MTGEAHRLIEERTYHHKVAKLWIWIGWLITMVISACYCIVSILSFESLLSLYNDSNKGVDDHELWAFLAATIVAPAMIIGFYVFGTIVLMKKTISEGGMTYSYGALHMSTLWMAALVLQSGVSIHAYKDRMKMWEKDGDADTDAVTGWTGGETTISQVAYVFAYILAFLYLFLFIFLMVFRNAAKRLIIDPRLEAKRAEEEREELHQAQLKKQWEEEERARREAEKSKLSSSKPIAPAPAPSKPIAKPAAKPAEEAAAAPPADDVAVKVDEEKGEEKGEEKKSSWWSRKKSKPEEEAKASTDGDAKV